MYEPDARLAGDGWAFVNAALWGAHAPRVQTPVRLGPIALSRSQTLLRRKFGGAPKVRAGLAFSGEGACGPQI